MLECERRFGEGYGLVRQFGGRFSAPPDIESFRALPNDDGVGGAARHFEVEHNAIGNAALWQSHADQTTARGEIPWRSLESPPLDDDSSRHPGRTARSASLNKLRTNEDRTC